MGLCMAIMSLPATAAWYASYGMWWTAAFVALGLGGIAMAARHTRVGGWKQGRHWVHLIAGSAGMVIMTLAMTSTSSGPILALGSSMADMPGMEHMASTTGTPQMEGMGSMHGMESMQGMHSMPGMDMSGMAPSAGAGTSGGSSSVWRWVIAAFALYFLLSIAASVRVRVRGTDKRLATGRSWGRWLLSAPDTLVVFLASLTISVWDKARSGEGRAGRGRRRKVGAAPDAALAAHIGMGAAMSGMLLMMAT
ncbi:aromatic ring-opening dioxygenase LigA [Streptomyces regalis]|uniref:Aromatic ring-opening dioxygenase LigA n=2 Tax=Streptomyces regalis TaxID=68262 RepID=A0A0X3VS66_9ACTN|nr:aromatic ring-opening dioxygenase LigA [Streptomyces regalis]